MYVGQPGIIFNFPFFGGGGSLKLYCKEPNSFMVPKMNLQQCGVSEGPSEFLTWTPIPQFPHRLKKRQREREREDRICVVQCILQMWGFCCFLPGRVFAVGFHGSVGFIYVLISLFYILCPRDRNEKLKFFSKSKSRGKLMGYLTQILKVHLELYFSLCPSDVSEFYLSKVTKSEV